MPYVIGGLVLVGVVALLNLALLMVILRRWQELEVVRRQDDFATRGPQLGDRLPDFAITAISGRGLTQDDFRSGELLLGVFSQDCPSCADSLPDFAARADEVRESGGRVVALVMGSDVGESDLTAKLVGPADEVVAEPEASPLFKALRVAGFPTILNYRGGVITAPSPADRDPVPAAT